MQSTHSLEARQAGKVVFASDGKWLHPLLELERFLLASGIDPASLTLHDKIVGRAAALLIVRLGIREVHAGVLSRLGQRALEAAGVCCSWAEVVERIDCRTEAILEHVDDPHEAHWIVVERARAASARPRPADSGDAVAAG